ncbi:hypothetical protein NEOKW01_1781 [Nematocida sp. AWRm80]|nr:hypothetical protein NEOKW01_1781 [Nematocida sp. AWRm80]
MSLEADSGQSSKKVIIKDPLKRLKQLEEQPTEVTYNTSKPSSKREERLKEQLTEDLLRNQKIRRKIEIKENDPVRIPTKRSKKKNRLEETHSFSLYNALNEEYNGPNHKDVLNSAFKELHKMVDIYMDNTQHPLEYAVTIKHEQDVRDYKNNIQRIQIQNRKRNNLVMELKRTGVYKEEVSNNTDASNTDSGNTNASKPDAIETLLIDILDQIDMEKVVANDFPVPEMITYILNKSIKSSKLQNDIENINQNSINTDGLHRTSSFTKKLELSIKATEDHIQKLDLQSSEKTKKGTKKSTTNKLSRFLSGNTTKEKNNLPKDTPQENSSSIEENTLNTPIINENTSPTKSETLLFKDEDIERIDLVTSGILKKIKESLEAQIKDSTVDTWKIVDDLMVKQVVTSNLREKIFYSALQYLQRIKPNLVTKDFSIEKKSDGLDKLKDILKEHLIHILKTVYLQYLIRTTFNIEETLRKINDNAYTSIQKYLQKLDDNELFSLADIMKSFASQPYLDAYLGYHHVLSIYLKMLYHRKYCTSIKEYNKELSRQLNSYMKEILLDKPNTKMELEVIDIKTKETMLNENNVCKPRQLLNIEEHEIFAKNKYNLDTQTTFNILNKGKKKVFDYTLNGKELDSDKLLKGIDIIYDPADLNTFKAIHEEVSMEDNRQIMDSLTNLLALKTGKKQTKPKEVDDSEDLFQLSSYDDDLAKLFSMMKPIYDVYHWLDKILSIYSPTVPKDQSKESLDYKYNIPHYFLDASKDVPMPNSTSLGKNDICKRGIDKYNPYCLNCQCNNLLYLMYVLIWMHDMSLLSPEQINNLVDIEYLGHKMEKLYISKQDLATLRNSLQESEKKNKLKTEKIDKTHPNNVIALSTSSPDLFTQSQNTPKPIDKVYDVTMSNLKSTENISDLPLDTSANFKDKTSIFLYPNQKRMWLEPDSKEFVKLGSTMYEHGTTYQIEDIKQIYKNIESTGKPSKYYVKTISPDEYDKLTDTDTLTNNRVYIDMKIAKYTVAKQNPDGTISLDMNVDKTQVCDFTNIFKCYKKLITSKKISPKHIKAYTELQEGLNYLRNCYMIESPNAAKLFDISVIIARLLSIGGSLPFYDGLVDYTKNADDPNYLLNIYKKYAETIESIILGSNDQNQIEIFKKSLKDIKAVNEEWESVQGIMKCTQYFNPQTQQLEELDHKKWYRSLNHLQHFVKYLLLENEKQTNDHAIEDLILSSHNGLQAFLNWVNNSIILLNLDITDSQYKADIDNDLGKYKTSEEITRSLNNAFQSNTNLYDSYNSLNSTLPRTTKKTGSSLSLETNLNANGDNSFYLPPKQSFSSTATTTGTTTTPIVTTTPISPGATTVATSDNANDNIDGSKTFTSSGYMHGEPLKDTKAAMSSNSRSRIDDDSVSDDSVFGRQPDPRTGGNLNGHSHDNTIGLIEWLFRKNWKRTLICIVSILLFIIALSIVGLLAAHHQPEHHIL